MMNVAEYFNHYLHFPARGRKQVFHQAGDILDRLSLFTFPRKGTETRLSLCGNSDGLYLHHYLHFPVRGRKPRTGGVACHINPSLFAFPRKGTETGSSLP